MPVALVSLLAPTVSESSSKEPGQATASVRSSTGSKEEDDRFNQKEDDVADIINSKDRGLDWAELHLKLLLLCWDAWPSPASTVKT